MDYTYHRYSGAECANAKTTDESTNSELRPRMFGSHLNDDTDDEDAAFDRHGPTTAQPIGYSGVRVKEESTGNEEKGLTLLLLARR
jgi:hypothetical protein